jgi:hypothetical protein
MAATATRPARGAPGSLARRTGSGSFHMLILLIIQYVLGIAYNLYGTAPTASKKLALFSSPLLAAHVVVGTLLILVAVYLVVLAIRARVPVGIAMSVVGLLALLGAWGSGSAFAQKGADGYSMAMAVLTAVALLCYLVNLRVLGRHPAE